MFRFVYASLTGASAKIMAQKILIIFISRVVFVNYFSSMNDCLILEILMVYDCILNYLCHLRTYVRHTLDVVKFRGNYFDKR